MGRPMDRVVGCIWFALLIGIILRRTLLDILARPTATPVASFREAAFRDALANLDRAPASDVLSLGGRFVAPSLEYGADRQRVARAAMRTYPDAAWILCFDTDGFVREAALRRLNSPAVSMGRFIAVALRLNDWVPEVRSTAIKAFQRVWPITSPEVVADAIPYLLRQRFVWRRWGHEAACVDEVLGDPTIANAFTSLLLRGNSGPLGKTLSQALRFEIYDSALAKLASEAKLPAVRAMALQTILTGKATWPVGYGWAWVDKSMGERRRILLTESRAISTPEPPGLLEAGIADRSALVRKVAADAVVERMKDLPNIVEIMGRLAKDRSSAVRDRADYIARRLKP